MEHPAAKVLVELADLQDQEVGDGTTSVVSHLRGTKHVLKLSKGLRCNDFVTEGRRA